MSAAEAFLLAFRAYCDGHLWTAVVVGVPLGIGLSALGDIIGRRLNR